MDLNAFADSLAELSSSKGDWSARCHVVGIMVSALAIALLSVKFVGEDISGWLTAAGSAIVGFGLWLSRRAQRMNWDARFIRRRALLANALGYSEAVSEGLDVITEAVMTQQVRSTPSSERAGYYSSNSAQGITRLEENLLESIVWTEKLYRAAKRRLLVRAVVTTVFATALGGGIVLGGTGALDARAALQLASVVLVFVVSADQFDSAGRWEWASAEARRLRHVLSSTRSNDFSEQRTVRIWAAFADYAVLTTVAPAIPRGLYEHHQVELGALSSAVLSQKK